MSYCNDRGSRINHLQEQGLCGFAHFLVLGTFLGGIVNGWGKLIENNLDVSGVGNFRNEGKCGYTLLELHGFE
jgi:hypothetical protein